MRLRLPAVALLLLCLAGGAHADEKRQGYCQTQVTGARVTSCVIHVYLNGTTTHAQIYSDNLRTPKANPFTADATTGLWFFYADSGRYDLNESGGSPTISPAYTLSDFLFEDIFALNTGLTLQYVASQTVAAATTGVLRLGPGDCISWRNNANSADKCLTENGSDLLTYDGVVLPTLSANSTFTGNNTFSGTTLLTGTTTLSGALNANNGGALVGTFTGPTTLSGLLNANGGGALNGTFSGSTILSGLATIADLNGLKYVDGTKYTTAATALAACPAAGCTIDMRAGTVLDLGTFDPGAKSVTLLLGPYTYQVTQLVLETNFHIIGAGDGNYASSSTSTTVLQACSTCATTNTVVLGTNGGNGGPIQHASMEGLRIYGATADTAIGMNLKTVNGAGTGIWYSTFRNMCVGACGPGGASANGFSGGAIVLDATATNTINQFLDFYNVSALKTNGGGPSLSLLGTNGQMNFIQCPFDGTTRNDGTTVVQIANSSGNGGPYSIIFNGATVQHGSTGINIAGAYSITFIGTHFELVGQAISINSGVGGFISGGITFIGSTCQNFCGNNTGAGWFAKTTTPNGISVAFIKNQIQNTADAIYTGFTNLSQFISMGDESDSSTGITALSNIGNNIPLTAVFTTTVATSETVAVTGASSSSHCWAEPTNSTAAALTGVYLSGPTANAVTLNHSATSGGTFNVYCTPN